jgi:5-methylcytosine-specific restriction endonuclease McrA
VAGTYVCAYFDMLNAEVLILNNDYQPLNVVNVKRAVVLVFLGKAEVLHTNTHFIATVSGGHEAPSVVRLRYHVRRPYPELHLSRRSVLARDDYTCQYCGRPSRDLTVDHVAPKRLGGESTWENLVACCRKCNTRKGDKTLQQCGMKLIRRPRRPKFIPYISLSKYVVDGKNQAWKEYLPFVQ